MYSIRVSGDLAELMSQIDHVENLDKKGLTGTISEALRESTMERFKRGKSPDGKPWQPSIRAMTGGGQTLIASTQLRNSIRSQSDNTGFAVGTNVVYAATHQLGAKGRVIIAKQAGSLKFKIGNKFICRKSVKVNIPARPFLGISEEDMEEIKGTIDDFMEM